MSLSWFSCDSSNIVELDFGVFLCREENCSTQRKTSENGENQRKTQPTYGTEPESNPGQIAGRRTLSPLRHPCSPLPSNHEVRLPRFVFPLVLIFVLFVHCEAPALEIIQQLPLIINGRLRLTNIKFESTQTYLIQGLPSKRQGRGWLGMKARS